MEAVAAPTAEPPPVDNVSPTYGRRRAAQKAIDMIQQKPKKFGVFCRHHAPLRFGT